MSSEDELDSPPPEMYSLEQMLDRFLVEVEQINSRNQSNYRRLETQLRCQFSHIRRELRSQVSREFIQLKRELAAPERFRYFARLPPEVRAKIWRLALPVRVVEVHSTFLAPNRPTPPNVNTTNRLPPPAIAHVCAEARRIAMYDAGFHQTKIIVTQLTNPWARTSGPGPPPGATGALTPSSVHQAWTWFSPRRDWLKMPAPGPPGPPIARPTGSIEELVATAQNVLIKRVSPGGETTRIIDRLALGQCPSLRTLGVVLGSCIVCRQLSMVLETELFGDDVMRIVDLQDEQEVAWVARVMRRDAQSLIERTDEGRQQAERADAWEDHLQCLREGRPWESSLVWNLHWSPARDTTFRVSWLLSKYRKTPATFPLHQVIDDAAMQLVDPQHPWVQAELAAMPEIRTLYMFLFDNLDGPDSRRLYGQEPFTRIQTIATT